MHLKLVSLLAAAFLLSSPARAFTCGELWQGWISSQKAASEQTAADHFEAGFFAGYVYVLGNVSQHINFPDGSTYKDWAKAVGAYLESGPDRHAEKGPMCIDDALIETYGRL